MALLMISQTLLKASLSSVLALILFLQEGIMCCTTSRHIQYRHMHRIFRFFVELLSQNRSGEDFLQRVPRLSLANEKLATASKQARH